MSCEISLVTSNQSDCESEEIHFDKCRCEIREPNRIEHLMPEQIPTYGTVNIATEITTVAVSYTHLVTFTQLRFYISQFTICEGNFPSILSEYELIDLSRGTSLGVPRQYYSLNEITAVEFNLCLLYTSRCV